MIIDNKTKKLHEDLNQHIKAGNKLSILTGLFSLYAFDELKTELNSLEQCRILFSQFKGFSVTQDSNTSPFGELTGTKFETRYRNKLNQQSLAKDFAKWLEDKADIKLVKQQGTLAQNVIHLDSNEPVTYTGAQFTGAGLGLTESESLDMITSSTDVNETKQMLNWFDSVWNNNHQLIEAKELLLKEVDKLSRDNEPKYIYFLTLCHLFKDFVEDLDDERIIRSKTGFRETIVWNKLYNFQKDGVLGAIEKLEKYNGCIIADSVGLGKTFEALAVIKYYELRNDRVLVICPKKLRDNWSVYTINDKRNLLAQDRFNYDVLNHTDLSRTKGYSGEINLETLNWSNYDLVVIDESHNFRNKPNKSDDKSASRYERLLEQVIKAGVKTKVLMLSATPVNNRMNDLKNQIAFITEGKDSALVDEGINNIEHTLRTAQTRFNQWNKQEADERKVEQLIDSMNFDYFKLLDTLTIARSRKHIEKYYDTTALGKFPQRLQPLNIKSDIDTDNSFPPLQEINKTIRRLSLAGYAPLKYVRMEKKGEYARRYDMDLGGGKGVFKQVDRQDSLIHLMRINLLKRMESSIHSFRLTAEKVLNQVDGLLSKITAHEIGDFEELNIEDLILESPEYEPFLIGNKVKVLLQDLDLIRFRQDLEADRVFLERIVEESQQITAVKDAKLADLKSIIANKIENPINQKQTEENIIVKNKKIIIFTAFADTAEYLYQNINQWAQGNLMVHSALITGSGTNKSTMQGAGNELNMLLTHFSPISKERVKVAPEATDQIDILIATDCISEGQNLQDCDYLVNYDIHWNPVRIIQRFGRVDRLGSRNQVIQLVNFWPNMELDEYINLEARVSGRMVLLDISATGEENVIEQDAKQMNDLEYRRKQLKQLQDSVMDLEDISGGVSITDLTLNDFRMDLSSYLKDEKQQGESSFENSPLGLYSAISLDNINSSLANESKLKSGVIFCLKDINNTVQVDDNYPLRPYYLAYVSDAGEVVFSFTQAKKILDVIKTVGLHNTELNHDAIGTKNHKPTSHYQSLLEIAVTNIAGKSEEKGVESLFARGGTVLSQESSQSVNDFEVVSYMVLV
ncbi:helicase [Thalassotalea loyana]|uniref:Helicase n=1 Tax=Thalassotalea loyana TaxID=280483 RepID=A0ABQ6HFZ7_9GAMM|nr:helicase-related protein [Thalassotalea loyana]GLX87003.1 helicase [Thalassotalea loyana]